MAFLDNLDRKISQLGQGAMQKTKNVSDSVRLSSAVKEEENKQMEIFRQMGSYYYRMYANQAEGQMKAWCDSVKASQAVIAQYQEQLKILKGVTYCPNCNAEVPLTSAFCSNCGAKMVPQTPVAPAVSGRVCPACGSPVEEGQRFCTNCGSGIPVAPAAPAAPAAPVVPEVSPAAPPAEEYVQEEVRQCGTCGAVLGEGQMYCTNCGSKYEEPQAAPVYEEVPAAPVFEEVPAAPVYEEPAAPAANVCPTCGKELKEGQMFCTNCGTRL